MSRNHVPHAAFLATLATCATAFGSITVTLDVLDPGDGGAQPPPGVVVVDVFVDVSADDYWTAAGLRGVALNGARILYAHDPNTGEAVLVSPGTGDRFVTFASQPRPRDANGRFNNGGASVAGRYCPTGPVITATSSEVNVAWYRYMPDSGVDGVDGAIFRVALRTSEGCTSQGTFRVLPLQPPWPGRAPVFECRCDTFDDSGVAVASFDDPSLVGTSWGVYEDTFGPPCPYDFNCDWRIDLADLAEMLPAFGHCFGEPGFDSRTDFDRDDCTGLTDLSEFLTNFGESYSPYLGCF